ncbi:MAG: PLP-dependent aspartate aminotransferase family protein [Bdellovibrionota bacterium]
MTQKKDSDARKEHIATQAIHAGEGRTRPGDAVTTPVFQTSTYVFSDTAELRDYMEGRKQRMEYGRYGNPTQRAAEEKIAALEGAEDALLFSSGMSAVTTALLSFVSSGTEIVLTSDCYRKTRQFSNQILKKLGVHVHLVGPDDYAGMEKLFSEKKPRLLISESPTNPYLNVLDLPHVVSLAKKYRVKVLIDSTFATPVNQRPLDYGVDLVVHSATKYLGGHNDLLAGVICGKEELVHGIREVQSTLGCVSDPHSAYLLIRGLKTLPIRVEHQNRSAQKISEWLEKQPKVEKVHYPGLPSHPHHKVAKAQMKGFGGVVSFELKASIEAISKFVDACQIPYIAPSLGGVESLIEQPALMSFYELSTEERLAIGIKDNLVRLSVGLEDPDDLIADLGQALKKL